MIAGSAPEPRRTVYADMGYIIALVVLLIVVPLLFILFSRRTGAAGGTAVKWRGDRGVTVEQPSSDQPTPRADTVNRASPEAERKLPPG